MSRGQQGGGSAGAGAGVGDAEAKALAKAKAYRNYGLDLQRGRVQDCVKAGVLEPTLSKVKQLKSAVEACVAIMR